MFFNTGASDFNINIKKLISFCLEVKPSAVIITNPNNPSGRLVKKEEIIFLLLALKQKNIYLMVDESFMEFSGTNESVLAAVPEYKNLIVIKSFTKYFGVPGLRSGALFLREKEKIITPSWNINSLSAAAAAEIAVRPGNYIKPPAVFFRAKNKFFSALKDIKEIKVYPSNADFFLCRILTRLTARGLYGKLAARRIKIRDCGNFHGLNKKYFRVTVKTEKENGYFLKHLKEALGGK